MWLLIACLGYSLLSIVALLDKIVVSREKVNPLQFTFFSTIMLAPVAVVLPFISLPNTSPEWWAIVIAGFSYGAALYCTYTSFAAGEVSHNGPLIGAITPLCTFILAMIFLPEPLGAKQLGAIGLLILGSLITTFTKNRNMRDWHTSVIYSFLAGFFFASFFIASKYAYETMGFGTGFLWILGSMGLFGVILLRSDNVRRSLRQRKKTVKKTKQPFVLMAFDKVAAGVGVVLIQYALSQGGSPTIINALTGLQYALLIILVAVLSKVKPSLYSEKYDHGELAQEGVAVVVIGLGLALLVL